MRKMRKMRKRGREMDIDDSPVLLNLPLDFNIQV
jgi:hypothetical protein